MLNTLVNFLLLGKHALELLFHIDDSWTFINHGAFGVALKPTLREAGAWQKVSQKRRD